MQDPSRNLTEKEKKVLISDLCEFVNLFNEKDMIKEGETIHITTPDRESIELTKEEIINLCEKISKF